MSNVDMTPLLFLTIFLCLSVAELNFNVKDFTYDQTNYTLEPPYNVHNWIQNLQLQTCAFVAIGLKYFAIFVENITESRETTLKSSKYFVGICHQSTLENWDFCSPSLSKKRKYKCRFKLKAGVYHPKVHRRFCDIRVMVNNKDCVCESTLGGEPMFKVRGFPTCYIPPLPYTLCKYNVCGLSSCEGLKESELYTVRCDPDCTFGNPFCEGPLYRTSKPPEIKSAWSKWSRELENTTGGESPESTMETKGKNRRSVATCINKYTGKPDLDCLGPGTGCCPGNVDCTCDTFEENGVLKLERSIYSEDESNILIKRHSLKGLFPKKIYRFPFRRKKSIRQNYRFLRDTDYDIEDDDDEEENNDLGEDIVLEEDNEPPVPLETTTTSCQACEKGEIDAEVKHGMAEERSKMEKNNTLSSISRNDGKVVDISIILILVVVFLFILNKFLFI
ncbi:unnamed protein product [Psylliodes chrysocephalus]|uniref:Uncharacterized protein n=1 Tax=Psylliodes chrysocephalus TaxID=3402493 RepID=A0A9P0CU16_9CUCU|nr:unnamed protein product [Psylliodes chrysocephala]